MSKHEKDKTLGEAKNFEFKTLRSISRSDIPLNRGRGHGASLNDMQVVKDFNLLLDTVNASGISPYEVVKEIDTTTAEMKMQRSQRKSFTQSLRSLLKECVKEHGLTGQIDVRECNKGERFFIVGREL